jgi:hypothetical protein
MNLSAKRQRAIAMLGFCMAISLIASACGGSGGTSIGARATPSSSIGPEGPPVPTSTYKPSPRPSTKSAGTKSTTSSGAKATPPPPPKLPWTPQNYKLRAWVTPSCVPLGGTATLHVETVPDARIAYEAIYSDGYGGSIPPYGRNYGGNDKGIADTWGRWTHSWKVAPHAPSGPGRVNMNYTGPLFYVANAAGKC